MKSKKKLLFPIESKYLVEGKTNVVGVGLWGGGGCFSTEEKNEPSQRNFMRLQMLKVGLKSLYPVV